MKFDLALLKHSQIPSIFSQYLKLNQQGAAYTALCPFHNEKTPSFQLDDKQGGTWLFKCFGCGKGGSVVDFIELIEHISVKEAIAKVTEKLGPNKEWIQGARETQENFKPLTELAGAPEKPKTVYKMSDWIKVEAAFDKSTAAQKWLAEERGISLETAKAMRIGYCQSHKYKIKDGNADQRDKGWIMFPRVEGQGDKEKVVAIKFRSISKKLFSQVNNMDSRAIFNIETVNPMEPVYVTEGELDAMILEQAGFRAVSCPSAGVEISTESKIKLKLAERIFLAGDNDGGVGNEYMKKLARELGENTHMLIWPDGKDANDFFRGDACKRNVDEFALQVRRLAHRAQNAPPEGFESVIDRLRASEGSDMSADEDRLHMAINEGDNLYEVDRMTYTPRGGVVVIYSTYSGTGKSMFKSQILLTEARRGEVVVDLSPEIRDDEYLSLIVSQVTGPSVPGGLRRTSKIDRKYFIETADRLDKPTLRGTDMRFYVGHTVLGQTEAEVLQFLENTIRTLGVTRFAIDTFHRLIFADGKTNQVQAEGTMIKKIEALGIKYGTIFILICQSNAEAEGIQNLKHDAHGVLRGSREIRDIPASIYLLHRKMRSQSEGENPDDVLELETGVFAKKTRYKGPGKPQCFLTLREEVSLFYPKASPDQEQAAADRPPDPPSSGMPEGYDIG